MNWLIPASLMYVSSVVFYLLLKRYQKMGLTDDLINLFLFAIPCIIFAGMIFINKYSFSISLSYIILIFVSAFFFGVLGNIFALESIRLAPNIGYALSIYRSYVVVTTIFSIIFLKSGIDLKQILAIILIVLFSSLMLISKTNKKTDKKHSWIFFAVISCFLFGGYSLFSKYLLNEKLQIPVYSFYFYFFSAIIFLFFISLRKKDSINKTNLLPLVTLGIISGFFNYFMQLGFLLAPNVNYVNAINTSSTAIIAVSSFLLYKEELSFKKFIGVIGIISGIIVLII